MTRYARRHVPGTSVHVIGRFTDHQFRLDSVAAREIYLGHLERVLDRADWRLLLFGLMSSHTHLGLLAGDDPPWRILKPLHTAVARDLNKLHRRFGPVFAERATTIVMPVERVGVLAPYVHNNPVRAGIVAWAGESAWTSHRAWIGLDPCPSFLAADLGLRLAGFDGTSDGRAAFDAVVRARSADPRDRTLSTPSIDTVRAAVRRDLGIPIELTSPELTEHGIEVGVIDAGQVAPRWSGDLHDVVDVVADLMGLDAEDIQSISRRRVVVQARRIVAAAAVLRLRRPASEVASLLGLSRPSISTLVQQARSVAEEAELVARTVRGTEGRLADWREAASGPLP